MFTAFGSVFSLLLGYSRVPDASVRDGVYLCRASANSESCIPVRSSRTALRCGSEPARWQPVSSVSTP